MPVPAPIAQQTYRVTLLDTGPEQGAFANNINNAGEVSGFVYTNIPDDGIGPPRTLSSSKAVRWRFPSARPTLLDASGLAFASNLNARGEIVGTGCTSSGECGGLLWKKKEPLFVGSLGSNGTLTGINSLGEIVGIVTDVSGVEHAALFTEKSQHILGTLPNGAGSEGYGINDKGVVVGLTRHLASDINGIAWYYATVWVKGVPTDLGTVGGKAAAAIAINNSGEIAGYMITKDPNPMLEPVLWHGQVGRILPAVGGVEGQALAINSRGQVVGWSQDSSGYEVLTVWDHGIPTNLTALISELQTDGFFNNPDAIGINDFGQIVVNTEIGRALVLTPNTAEELLKELSARVASAKMKGIEHLAVNALADYQAGDLIATCALLDGIQHQLVESRRRKDRAEDLRDEVHNIQGTIGCSASSRDDGDAWHDD